MEQFEPEILNSWSNNTVMFVFQSGIGLGSNPGQNILRNGRLPETCDTVLFWFPNPG